jgi:hypothetical protein
MTRVSLCVFLLHLSVPCGQHFIRRIVATADRDHPGTYFSIVDFDSFDSAMENSGRPETSELAAKMAALCDGPVIFHNLDVMWKDTGDGG